MGCGDATRWVSVWKDGNGKLIRCKSIKQRYHLLQRNVVKTIVFEQQHYHILRKQNVSASRIKPGQQRKQLPIAFKNVGNDQIVTGIAHMAGKLNTSKSVSSRVMKQLVEVGDINREVIRVDLGNFCSNINMELVHRQWDTLKKDWGLVLHNGTGFYTILGSVITLNYETRAQRKQVKWLASKRVIQHLLDRFVDVQSLHSAVYGEQSHTAVVDQWQWLIGQMDMICPE